MTLDPHQFYDNPLIARYAALSLARLCAREPPTVAQYDPAAPTSEPSSAPNRPNRAELSMPRSLACAVDRAGLLARLFPPFTQAWYTPFVCPVSAGQCPSVASGAVVGKNGRPPAEGTLHGEGRQTGEHP